MEDAARFLDSLVILRSRGLHNLHGALLDNSALLLCGTFLYVGPIGFYI